MFHLVARARSGRLLVHSWEEARELFFRLGRALPGTNAACIMPTHVHVQHPGDVHARFVRALVDFVRWRHARRGERGPVLERPVPPPVWRDGADKVRRDARYIALNPCRARLVADPLSWPFGTHRDACGLAVPAIRRRMPDVVSWHRYVSSDPTVAVGGTFLPVAPIGDPTLCQLRDAVSAITRTPVHALHARGPARTLLVAAARALTTAPQREIADAAGLLPRQVRRVASLGAAHLAAVAAVLRDPRFPALHGGERAWRDLPCDPIAWLTDD